jgi:hypothetical protein
MRKLIKCFQIMRAALVPAFVTTMLHSTEFNALTVFQQPAHFRLVECAEIGKQIERAINNGFQLRVLAAEDDAARMLRVGGADQQIGFTAACRTAVK